MRPPGGPRGVPRKSQPEATPMSTKPRKKPEELRSQQWFGRQDRDGFAYRSWLKGKGIPHDQFDGRPVIGICNTFSELNPCNSHFRTIAEQVKIGVYEAGGFPLEFPVMSLGEVLLRPTAMLYRNLASMDVEESIRGNPIDGVVLLMGCDKTTPALVMGASSANLPTIGVSGGPMLNGKWRGQELGSGTGVWSMSEQVRAGTLKLQDFFDAESCMHRSHGHCMTMGTASTMASMVEALGLGLPGNAAYPAVDGRRNVIARNAGRRIVDLVHEDVKIGDIITRQAFENAIKTLAAIGGSTNAVIHLIAIAGRLGVKLSIDDFEKLASEMPCLLDIQPSGKHLMEDFCYAGGLPAVMKEISSVLHLDHVTVTGKTVRENIADARNDNPDVIKTVDKPFKAKAGIAILRGNLAPRGAVIKPSAATPELMVHKGRAVVFEDSDDFHKRIDDPNLDVDESCILVLKNCGPKGYPGMAEVGNMPLPPKVLKKGITDMVRISDARMSGTAYGTVVLHTAPEAAAGGPLALVKNGDVIELDVPKRRLHLHVSDDELAKRRAQWKPPTPRLTSGYWKLYIDHVLQADEGADLDFLVGQRGAFVPKDNH
jgi:L-arabonate dehydrase